MTEKPQEFDERLIDELAEALEDAIRGNDATAVSEVLEQLPKDEVAHTLWHLDIDEQRRLVELLNTTEAAEVLSELPESQAAEVLEGVTTSRAAAILDQLPSDEQADLLGAIPKRLSHQILQQMTPEEAADARRLMQYPPDTAGGLMITEYLAFDEGLTVQEVIEDLRENARRYKRYDVLYFYTVGENGRLQGVLRVRDLLLTDGRTHLRDLAIPDPITVSPETPLDELDHLFKRYRFFGLPVVDDAGRLIGMVRRHDIEEAIAKRASQNLLKYLGISGGEEVRSMPLRERVKGRTAWLTINLFLDLIAASVIPFFEGTIAQVLAIVFFLPIISDMGGNTGSQSIGVTLRELTAGLITPRDAWRVIRSELPLALLNGLVVGILLGLVGWIWQANPYLGLVVGGALTANTVIAAALGGVMPLALTRLGVDPALASGPILTTITDLSGFLLILTGAHLMLPYLT